MTRLFRKDILIVTAIIIVTLLVVGFCGIKPVYAVKADKAKGGKIINRYTVLVLDTSGSIPFTMNNQTIYVADTAIDYVKTASSTFLDSIHSADGNNYIALVSYREKANVMSAFSKDYDALGSQIDALTAEGKLANMAEGLHEATRLLESIDDPNASKNIVLFTTGYTNTSEYDYNGHYGDDTVGSTWYRTDNKIPLYAYANVAFRTADAAKNKGIYVYTIGLFQPMAAMPDRGKNIVDFFKLTTSDIATSKDYYYPVYNPKSLRFTFKDVAEDIADDKEEEDKEVRIYANDEEKDDNKEEFIIKVSDVIGNSTSFEDYITSLNSKNYNPRLSYMLAGLSRAAYSDVPNGGNYMKTISSLGFEMRHADYHDDDTVAYSIASKKANNGPEVVLITIRGSYTSGEWTSNAVLGAAALAGFGKHQGFMKDADSVYEGLKYSLGGEIKKDNVIYVITGHSQGAAAGNLLAVRLYDEGIPTSAVFDYNFACPNVACLLNPMDWNPSGAHDNIFNIGNVEDPVTYLPSNLIRKKLMKINKISTWGKFGQSYWFVPDYKNSSIAGHDMIFYMKALKKKKGISTFYNYQSIPVGLIARIIGVHCPVDVVIYDRAGTKVASVINNKQKYYTSDRSEVLVCVEDDEKIIFLPKDKEYKVSLTATGNGEMKYDVCNANLANDEILEEKKFDFIKINSGKQLINEIKENQEPADTKLYVVDGEEKVIAEVREDGTEVEPSEIEGDISKSVIDPIEDQVYKGKYIRPSITVKMGSITLTKNKDYNLSYRSNKKIGTATITIKGKGKYSGKTTTTFRIIPKSTKIRTLSSKIGGFKVKWNRVSNCSGYEINYKKATDEQSSTDTISKRKTTSRTIQSLEDNQEYVVCIRSYKTVGKEKYYSAWSESKTVTTESIVTDGLYRSIGCGMPWSEGEFLKMPTQTKAGNRYVGFTSSKDYGYVSDLWYRNSKNGKKHVIAKSKKRNLNVDPFLGGFVSNGKTFWYVWINWIDDMNATYTLYAKAASGEEKEILTSKNEMKPGAFYDGWLYLSIYDESADNVFLKRLNVETGKLENVREGCIAFRSYDNYIICMDDRDDQHDAVINTQYIYDASNNKYTKLPVGEAAAYVTPTGIYSYEYGWDDINDVDTSIISRCNYDGTEKEVLYDGSGRTLWLTDTTARIEKETKGKYKKYDFIYETGKLKRAK